MTDSAVGRKFDLDVQLINPFIGAVQTILFKETGAKVSRSARPAMTIGSKLPHEITAIIGLTGALAGIVLISLPAATALKFFEVIVGEKKDTLDDLARSAIAEFANTIAGAASISFEEQGITVDISPPAVIQGRDAHLTTLNTPRVALALETDLGPMTVEIAVSRVKSAVG